MGAQLHVIFLETILSEVEMLEIMPDGTPILRARRLTYTTEEEKRADVTGEDPDYVWVDACIDLTKRVPVQWEPCVDEEWAPNVQVFYQDGGMHQLDVSFEAFDREYMDYLRNRPMRIPQCN